MKRRSLLMLLCFYILSHNVQKTSGIYPRFPNFPTADDPRVVVGGYKAVDDDILDYESPSPLQITHLRVRCEIAMRYARTAIVSNVYNPNKRPQEATFHVMLPDTAFISGFTMTVGKETYEAYVKEKEVAKQIYNDAVSQGVSAAHVATKARDSNHFTLKFNLEGKTNATYRLRYEELLVRRNGVYNLAINLLPGALVPKMDVVVHIRESQKITKLRVPELRTGNEIDAKETDAQNSKAVIRKGKNEREATIIFTPDLAEQRRLAEVYAEKTKKSSDFDFSNIGYESAEEEAENEGLLGQFVVQYDVEQPKNGEILVNDGYFVHFFAPPSSLPPLSKHAVFVLDTSGSMAGTKIEQLRKAMDAILSDLHPDDYFSIIEFNTYITIHDLKEADESAPTLSDHLPWITSKKNITIVPPAPATPENIEKAKIIVSRFDALGATNIFEALDVALKVIQHGFDGKTQPKNNNSTDSVNEETLEGCINGTENESEKELEPMIIFLTDGEPTVGIIDPTRIIRQLTEKNSGEKRTPLFSLAFGYDADRVFLRKLSLHNNGFMRQIYEASDAALQLVDFYEQVSSPLLADVKFVYPARQIKEGSLSQHQFRTINDGSEVAVVGRVAEGVNEITPQVLALRGDGERRSRASYVVNPKVPVNRSKDDRLPLERLWAYLTIKQLLDKRDVSDLDDITEDSPAQKALEIALQYEFVTPLTSLVVVRLNKTHPKNDVESVDAVNAESVDDLSFLAYRSSLSSKNSKQPTFTALTTGERLTVESDQGVVLFAESTKRLASASYGVSYGSSYGSSSYSSDSSGTSNSNGENGYGSGFKSQFSAQGQFSSSGQMQFNTINFMPLLPDGPNYKITVPVGTKRPEEFSTFAPITLRPFRPLEMYHLEGFEWVLAAINLDKEGIMIWNHGSLLTLKLSKDINPPKAEGGDVACGTNSTQLTYSGSDNVETLCVYITRCDKARYFAIDDYQRSFCVIDNGYAGVCCPKSEIDKTLNATAKVTSI